MSGPDLQVTPAFASPIISTDMPNADELNRRLRELFLARESEGDRYRKKQQTPTLQVNIFESEFDLFQWPDEPVRRLHEFCSQMLSYVVLQLNEYTPAEVGNLKVFWDCWFHITRSGGYVSAHTHPMASWSGVYCVSPGDTTSTRDNGVLRFLDARPQGNMYLDVGNARMRRPYGSGSVNYKLKSGQLLLFPSYLVHETSPYVGKDERITVAFNCSFHDLAATPKR
ncbi:MAG: hypothetical protein JWR16_6 [Nevskia sp.]|nr:hypothetical protein [Nevskia sp.]